MATEPLFLDQESVLALYSDMAETIGVGLGVVDSAKLDAAVCRPYNMYLYRQLSIPELAACVCYSLAKFHPFGDGNKRTALTSMDLFLRQNGWMSTSCPMRNAKLVEWMVADRLSEDKFTARIVKSCRPMDEDATGQ